MSVFRHIVGTMGKLFRGPKTDPDLVNGAANAISTLHYLLGRKLGANPKSLLRLGVDGRRHAWILERREDLTVLEEVYLDADYDMQIPVPSVIFDLGANFGAASVYFALRWPEAQIFSLEPSPELYTRLEHNTAGYPNITPLRFAAGAKDDVLPFTLSASSVGGGFFNTEAGAEVVEVAVRSMQSLMEVCRVSQIDLLKFDIEGAEGMMLEDASVLDSVGAFVGEVHPDLMQMPVADFLSRFEAFDTTRQELHGGRFLLRGVRRT